MRRQPHPNVQQHRGGLQDEKQTKSRVLIGQITSVDTINGQVTVTIHQTQEQFKLAIPLYGFSIKGLKSSWIRYMPQSSDFVKVEFEVDNTPTIVGYATFGEEFSASGERQGATASPRQSAYATVRRLADDNVNGLGTIYRRLRQGEWDMRSSGGAELYGTQDGTLTLAGGGGADIRLIKERQEFKSRSRLHVFEDNGVEVRFGEVKRKLLSSDINESTSKIPNTGAVLGGSSGVESTLREYKVVVGYPTPPLGTPLLKYWQLEAGNVTDGVGAPVVFQPAAQAAAQTLGATSVAPLLYRQQIFSGAPPSAGLVPNVTVQVDQLGNTQVTLLPTAAPVGLATTALRQYHHAVTTATLASSLPAGGVFLGSEGASQSASGVPGSFGVPQAYVLGTTWTINRVIMNSAKVLSHGLLSTGCWTVLAGALAALGVTVGAITTGPPPPTDPAMIKLLAGLTAFIGAATPAVAVGIAQEVALAAAITTFEASGLPTGYLSVKVFGE